MVGWERERQDRGVGEGRQDGPQRGYALRGLRHQEVEEGRGGAATAATVLGSDLGKVAAYNAGDGSPRRSPTRHHALLRPSDPFN